MEENPEYENIFKIINVTLLLSGIKVYEPKFKLYSKLEKLFDIVFYINLIWLYALTLGEFSWLIDAIITKKDFGLISIIILLITICLLTTSKTAPLYINKKTVISVIDQLRNIHPAFSDAGPSDHDDIQFTPEAGRKFEESERKFKDTERKMVQESVKILNFTTTSLAYFYTVVIASFSVSPLIAMSYEFFAKGSTDRKLPFLVKYGFDLFTTGRYPILFFHQVWSVVIAGFNLYCSDSLLYTFLSIFEMQFEVLSHHFEFVVVDSQELTRRRLVKLVRRHQQLIDLVDQVENLYNKSTLVHIVLSSFLICLSAFNIAFLEDKGVIVAFIVFLLQSLSQISLVCYFGDKLTTASSGMCNGIYMSRWYDADQGSKKILLLVLMRSQIPCTLTAFKFADMNRPTFTSILSRSWSYFALLQTMYE